MYYSFTEIISMIFVQLLYTKEGDGTTKIVTFV